jgi:hypothetical protein
MALYRSSNDAAILRALTHAMFNFMPISVLASVLGCITFSALWKRSRKIGDHASIWFQSIGAFLLVVALGPGLMFLFWIFLALIVAIWS